MVEPSFLALTTTPSIGPSLAELTCPVSAAAACGVPTAAAAVGCPCGVPCACAGDESGAAWMISAVNPATAVSLRFFRMDNLPAGLDCGVTSRPPACPVRIEPDLKPSRPFWPRLHLGVGYLCSSCALPGRPRRKP